MAKTSHARALNGDGSNLPARITYKPHEREAVHAQKVRLAARAKRGADYDGAANDNIAWPLATSLIREGNTELLKAAMAYRRIHDTAKSEAVLGGTSAPLGAGMSLDQRTHIKPNGSIAYKGARKVDYVEGQATMKVPPYVNDEDGIERNVVRIPRPWNGDRPVNDMIDAEGKLEFLRAIIGPLVEPLEMAVVDGATYQEIGNSVGVANRAGALGAGRATVHLALLRVRDALGELRREDLAA